MNNGPLNSSLDTRPSSTFFFCYLFPIVNYSINTKMICETQSVSYTKFNGVSSDSSRDRVNIVYELRGVAAKECVN